MKLNFMSTRFLRILVAAGYLLMCLLAGGIMYLWHYEWRLYVIDNSFLEFPVH